MSTPEMPSVASGDEDRLWGELAERIDAFLSAWAERPEPPALDDYLDELPRPWRRMMLGELAKVDMEQRLHTAAASWRVEDYVERWPELAEAGGPPADLIYEEYLIRRRLGEDVPPEEYFDRFTSQADELRRLMGLADPVVTTSLYTAQRPDDFQPGQRIDEFELLTVLGKGAFASVFLARQTSLERLVAIKISADRGAEPKTLAQLDHPNIVRVYDQRVLQGRKLRMLYMQYVAGGTLEHVIERTRDLPAMERNGRSFLAAVDRALDARGESPPAESSVRETLAEADWSEVVCRVGIRLAAALDYAHRRGVLHRDLKPANVMLSAEGTSKLVDFNISCCSGVEGASPAAYFGGSLAYMSPEQLEACNVRHERTPDDLDARSDIYALGVVLWELLTGERPFGRETLADDWVATLEQMTGRRRLGIGPSALARIPADCPVELRDVLLTCLEPEAARRFTSAGQLERQLRRCLDREATSLLAAPTSRFKRLLAGWPLAALVAAIFVPNLVAAVFNERYNTELIPPLRTVEAEFWIVKAAINGIGFPLGIAILVWRAWPVRRALGNLTRADHPAAERASPRLRRRCLALGHWAAVVSMTEWFAAGFIYPFAMDALGADMAVGDYAHFIFSLLLCGLVAGSYPYLLATALSVEVFYPLLLGREAITREESRTMVRLQRANWIYLVLAAAVPLLGMTLLLGFVFVETTIDRTARVIMMVVSAGGLAGFLLLLPIARSLQGSLAALLRLAAIDDRSERHK
ncbi:MAG: serine/threonine protein kinase [Planctomycetales bacterium]|nr:serine/threonine protein kinase [Planctomycetales bacterium]